MPPEEQQTYDRFKDTTPAGTVFGAETVDDGAAKGKSRSRGKKKKPEGGDANAEAEEAAPVAVEATPAAQGASDVEKKIKALRKRLGSICVLEAKAKEENVELNADQLSKIEAKAEVEAEILKWETLGDVDVGKKIKNLKKKLKQIDELEQKLKSGLSLNEDQQGKVEAKEEVMEELKTLEAQFVQSQKMQAIGQLAGGVAHDFNNLLTAISGHCDLLLLRHDQGDPDYADLVQINQNANRAAALVGQLLAFSRKQTLRPELLDLRDTLSDLTHLLNRLVGEKIELTLSHDPVLPAIRGDRRQLEQVLMNLVVNARDAMPDGGTIRIETERRLLLEPLKRDRAMVEPGEYASVKVSDAGVGIAQDSLQKVFEPFYTTKRTGEGTGQRHLAAEREDHARERGRHLGAERHVLAVLVDEVVHLLGDLLAALALVELLVLEHRRVVLLEREAAGRRAEVAEEPGLQPHLLGEEVARARGRLGVDRRSRLHVLRDRVA